MTRIERKYYAPVTPLAKTIDLQTIEPALRAFMAKHPRACSQSLDSGDTDRASLEDHVLGSPKYRDMPREPEDIAYALAPIWATLDFMALSGFLQPGVNDPKDDTYDLRAWWLGNAIADWAENAYGQGMQVHPTASEVELAFHILGVPCAFDDVDTLHIQMMAGRGHYAQEARTANANAAKQSRWIVWGLGALCLYNAVKLLF